MTAETLTLAERQVLAELEATSNGTTQSFAPIATKSGASSRIPPAADAPHIHYRAELLAATNDRDRAEVLDQARAELAAIRKRQAPIVDLVEPAEVTDARIRRKLDDGWTVAQVALNERVTETRVRRAAAGHDPAEQHDDTTSRVRELAAQGLTVRNIAMRLGIPKSTVHDLLRKAA